MRVAVVRRNKAKEHLFPRDHFDYECLQIGNQLETDGFIDQRSSTRSARMWISILAMAIATSLCVSVGVTLSQQSR
jgi:hypothetical protein